MSDLIAVAVARMTAPPEIAPPLCPVCSALYGYSAPALGGLPLWVHPANDCGMADISFCIPEQRSVTHD